ncbi:MAG: hypothetical protein N3G79_06320 [Sulfolobales archaeon]|nr:hypothetical protein [Sulfolobales archaeon]
MVKCPFCGYEDGFEVLKEWKFRFYLVRRVRCSRCSGIFNYYSGTTPRRKLSEFVIRVKPRGGG